MSAICWYPGQWWGTYKQARTVKWLEEHGIRRVITCAIDANDLCGTMENMNIELFVMNWETCHEYPCEDDWNRGMRFLEESLINEIPTLVHCRGRPIRSGKFMSYFWQKMFGVSSDCAYNWLRISFPEVF